MVWKKGDVGCLEATIFFSSSLFFKEAVFLTSLSFFSFFFVNESEIGNGHCRLLADGKSKNKKSNCIDVFFKDGEGIFFIGRVCFARCSGSFTTTVPEIDLIPVFLASSLYTCNHC